MKIVIIGNKTTPNGEPIADGGRIRTALYYKKLQEEGFDVSFVELQGWQKKIFSLIFQIKKAIKENDIVLLMSGPRSSRYLVKLCAFFNKKKRARIVFSMLGVGPIQQKIKKLEPNQVNEFINNKKTFGIKDSNMGKYLSKLNLILAQNEIIASWYKRFYSIENVDILDNFREIPSREKYENKTVEYNEEYVKIVYFSRLTEKKGVLDLLDIVKSINKGKLKRRLKLDIWGEMQLTEKEQEKFKEMLDKDVIYKGVLQNDKAIATLSEYNFMVFPTKYHGEGTSGSIIESLLAGTPVLCSSYSQAPLLITNGVDGMIFTINDLDSLRCKLNEILELTSEELKIYHKNAYINANRYDYKSQRKKFITFITGNMKEDNR